MVTMAPAPPQHEEEDVFFHDVWNYYAHATEDDDWTMPSYAHLGAVSTVSEFWAMHDATLRALPHSMLFVMREGVFPCWDDASNIQGGCLSVKVGRDQLRAAWPALTACLVGETLLRRPLAPPGPGDAPEGAARTAAAALRDADPEGWLCVNGVSVSPKRNFYIIKLWMRYGADWTRQHFEVLGDSTWETMYRSNLESIQGNHRAAATADCERRRH